jgi:hypothetical protein
MALTSNNERWIHEACKIPSHQSTKCTAKIFIFPLPNELLKNINNKFNLTAQVGGRGANSPQIFP